MARLSMDRLVDAPVAVAWDVITDHELYAEVAPNLSTVEVVEGEKDGMIRRCVDTNDNEWTESCSRWDDGRGFAVEVDVDRSDFHRRLFTRFEGEWRLSERPDGVLITITFEFDPKYGPFGVLVTRFFEYKAPAILNQIFDRWEAEIRSRISDSTETIERRDTDGVERTSNALSR